MPGLGPKVFCCVVCGKKTKPKESRKVTESVKLYLIKTLFTNSTEKDVICNKCKHSYYKSESTTPAIKKCSLSTDPDFIPSTTNQTNNPKIPPSVTLKIRSASKTHSRCLICKRHGPKLIVLSSVASHQAFIDSGCLIPAGVRCCPVHLNSDGHLINKDAIYDHSHLNRSSITQLLHHLRDVCLNHQDRLDFNKISDPDCKNLTGLTCAQFQDLFESIEPKIKATPCRSQKTTVGLFLLKLKSGMSNKLLSTLFRISKSSIQRGIQSVRQAVMQNFVPMHLGLESVTRERVIQYHTRLMAKEIFNIKDDEIILVIDGTYIFVQKSQNFTFQRRSFSFHKGRSLVKPMVIVTTTGHYVTIIGPYMVDGKNNDASILNHMLKKNVEDIRDYLHKKDMLVVDRGFRDSIEFLEELGIRAAMPSFLPKGSTQLPTEDANNSRLVTKVRWVVESSNARIKSWKYLDKVLPISQIPYIGDYVRIVCALSNMTDVTAWYCKCRAGAMVVGVCAHIAAAVWFLSSGRHLNQKIGVQDWGKFVSDAAEAPEVVDLSDTDSVVEE